MEILNRREQIGAKKLPPVIGEDVEKAGKSKYGVVKIGDGINVNNGVISVPASGGVVIDLGNYENSTYPTMSAETLAAVIEALSTGAPISFKLKEPISESGTTFDEHATHYTSSYLDEVGTVSGEEYHYVDIQFTNTGNIGSVEYDLSTGEPFD